MDFFSQNCFRPSDMQVSIISKRELDDKRRKLERETEKKREEKRKDERKRDREENRIKDKRKRWSDEANSYSKQL